MLLECRDTIIRLSDGLEEIRWPVPSLDRLDRCHLSYESASQFRLSCVLPINYGEEKPFKAALLSVRGNQVAEHSSLFPLSLFSIPRSVRSRLLHLSSFAPTPRSWWWNFPWKGNTRFVSPACLFSCVGSIRSPFLRSHI